MIYSIQALRFIAAFLVFIHHIYVVGGYENSLGYRGVDLFFVISGFIIYVVTDNGHDKFFVNRLIRIVPMYWGVTFLLIFLFYFMGDFINSDILDFSMVLKSLFFIPFYNPNFESFTPILNVGWTLNYEIFFYLIFAVAIMISPINRGLISSFIILIFFILGEIFNNTILSFYSNSIVFEFVLGIFLGFIYLKKNISFTKYLLSIFIGTLFFIPLLTVYLTHIPRIFIPGFISLIIIFTYVYSEPLFCKNQKTKKVIAYMGDISYAMYLSHFFIIVLFLRVIELDEYFSEFIYITLIFVVTLISSHVITYYFDMPIRSFMKKKLNQV